MKALPNLLPVQPFTKPVKGQALIPGSKSLTNRALLMAALCKEPVELSGALFSEDTELMAAALRALGLSVSEDAREGTMRIADQTRAFSSGKADLFVGLAGTAARFLTALCAAAPEGVWRLDGIAQMRKRPMRGLIDALRSLGADIRCLGEEGFFPLEIHARGLRGGAVRIDARESSQLLSALLMVAPLAATPVEITLVGGVRWPFVRMTTRLMEQFGQPAIEQTGADSLRVACGQVYHLGSSNSYRIEPDATAASYFLALPLVCGGALQLPGLHGPGAGLQGDTQFVEVLRTVGGALTEQSNALVTEYTRGSPLRGIDCDFGGFSDTFLTLAALAPLLKGTTKIRGIAHTRKQETDRVSGMARELRRLGQEVVEEEDSLTIHSKPLLQDQVIETYGDHRFAMSFAILGSYDLRGDGRPWLSISNPSCCSKTFPDFFELLDCVRENSV